MFVQNYGEMGGDPTPPQQPAAPVDATAQALEAERARVKALEDQVANLRNHQLRSAEVTNQQLNILRGQLSETLRPQATPTQQVAPTDDWMNFLTGNTQQTVPSTPATQAQGGMMTPDQVRQVLQEEKQREAQARFQEARKIEELNSRFMVEHPDLADNGQAVMLIKNQFESLSNLRPDLAADQRYQMAIENVKNNMLPLFGSQVPPPPPKEKQPKAPANPYMSNVFGAPPGQKSLQQNLGMVDPSSLDDKFAKRQKEMDAWQAQRAKLQGR